jgi:orotidine-5'-phosphate decarboxylase
MVDKKDKLIVALDVPDLGEAQRMVALLSPSVTMFKVGSQLFTACGPQAVAMVAARGARVFLDLKFHDIPNTVFHAVSSATGLGGIFMMTVHVSGGESMMKKAVEGAAAKAAQLHVPKPLMVGVTVLTSERNDGDTVNLVLERALLAREAGLDGVVCSPLEAGRIRSELGEKFIVVTPGIRDASSSGDDQQRAATAKDALNAGSDYLVVGRPIVHAKDPAAAAKKFLEEIVHGSGHTQK